MPSHLAHLIFAEETIREAFGNRFDEIKEQNPELLALGSQGPDMFYHNRRSKPSGLHYGSALHRKNYGRFVAALVQVMRESEDAGNGTRDSGGRQDRNDAGNGAPAGPRGGSGGGDAPFSSPGGLYAASWLTHAVMDRHLHPFINYFAGWGSPRPQQPSTHAFFERIIDVLLLEHKLDMKPWEFDFYGLIDGADTTMEWIRHALIRALRGTFTQAREDDRIAQRLSNAFADALGFYRYTNMVDWQELVRRLGIESARGNVGEGRLLRALAIFHPPSIPRDIDYANTRRAAWCHPCDQSRVYRASLWDLYEEARARAVRLLRELERAWNGSMPADSLQADAPGNGETRGDSLEAAIGNSDLSDTDDRPWPCPKRYSMQLPLTEMLQAIDLRLREEAARRQ
jgi:hypothetical protein